LNDDGHGHGHGRRRLPANLPREKVIHDLPKEQKPCPCCGKMRHVIGQEISEQLDYVPAKVTVIEHVRIKYACPSCEEKAAESGPLHAA
jgi:transposase